MMESPDGPRRLDEGPRQVTRDRETKSSLLQYHLGLFNDILQVQPQRHTEQQLKLEREKKKRQMLEDEQLELEKIRLKYQIENHGSKGDKDVLLVDDDDFEKKRKEIIKRQRDREKKRNEEENTLLLDRRKEKRDKACKLKWFEKEVKRSGEEKAWAEQAKRHMTDNIWMRRKEQQEKRKEELLHLTPKDKADEELMFKKALELSKVASKDTSARPKIFHSKGKVTDLADDCESVWDMKPPREEHDTSQKVPQSSHYGYAKAVLKSLDKYRSDPKESDRVCLKSEKTLTRTLETNVTGGFNDGRQISFGRGSGILKPGKTSLDKGWFSSKDVLEIRPTGFGTDQNIKRKKEVSNTDGNAFKSSKIFATDNDVISDGENWHRDCDDWYAYTEYIDGFPFPKATFVESKKVKPMTGEEPQIDQRPKPCNVSSKDKSYANKKVMNRFNTNHSSAHALVDDKQRSVESNSSRENVVKDKCNHETSAVSFDEQRKAESCPKTPDSMIRSENIVVQDYINSKNKVPLPVTTQESTVETMETSLARNNLVQGKEEINSMRIQNMVNEELPVDTESKQGHSNRKETGMFEEDIDQTPVYTMAGSIVGENEKMSDINHPSHGPYQTLTESSYDINQEQKIPDPNTLLAHFHQAYFQYQQQTQLSTEQHSLPGSVSYSQINCNTTVSCNEHSAPGFPGMKGPYDLESFYAAFGVNWAMMQVFDMMKNYHIIQDEQMNQNNESTSKTVKDSNLESSANLAQCDKTGESMREKDRTLCEEEDQNLQGKIIPKKDSELDESDISGIQDASHTSAIRLKGKLGTSDDDSLRMPKLPAVASQFTKKNLKSLKIDPSMCKASQQGNAEDRSKNFVNSSVNDIKKAVPIRSQSLQLNNFSTTIKDPGTAGGLLDLQETSHCGNKNGIVCNSTEDMTDEGCGWIETGDITNTISNTGIFDERWVQNNATLDQADIKVTSKEASCQQNESSEKNNGGHEVNHGVPSKLGQTFHALVAKEYRKRLNPLVTAPNPLVTAPVSKKVDAVDQKKDLYAGCESTAERNLRIRNMIIQMREKENLPQPVQSLEGGSRKLSY